MIDLKSFFDLLPAPFWGVLGTVFGAIITFLASFLANAGSNNRLKIQLEYDGNQKNIDRMNAMRHGVYIALVEEMTKASSYFGALPTGDITQKDISKDLQGFYVAAAKLSLVSSAETQDAIDNLGVEYSKLIFVLMQRLSPLHDAYTARELNAKFYEEMMSGVRRLIGEMNSFNESARSDEHVFEALQNSYKYFIAQAELYANKRREAFELYSILHGEYSALLMQDMRLIAPLHAEVLIAVRKDLGVHTDVDRLRGKVNAQWDEINKSMNESLEKINKAD